MTNRVVKLLSLIAILLIALILAITNPSYERHQQAIRSVLVQGHPLAGLIVGGIAAQLTEYHSFGLFSYTTMDREVVSIGFVGYVWVKR